MRYILHPGTVCSINDGQCHYISAQELAKLYKIPFGDCIVLNSSDLSTYLRFKKEKGDIHLYPKPDGNYSFQR